MAIYHCSANIISRGDGKSAVAAAAYRSGEKLHDERLGVEHDYTLKQDVLHTEILLPKDAPDWMSNREKLWNAVEAIEKRKDSQLAREFNLALPRELTQAQNIALAREFVQEQFVKKGMVADLAIHSGHASDGQDQPHMHVMLTMRDVTPEGFGQKNRDWNKKEHLLEWREAWAEKVNHHLAREGHDLRIDHRSFEEQGINLAPQSKIGPTAAREHCARLAEHQRIAFENGERLIQDPNIALHAMTQQQSTFTHHDLARFVNRHTRDAEQFERAYAAIQQSDHLISLGKDERGRERLTTQDQLDLETKMLGQAKQLTDANDHEIPHATRDRIASARNLSPDQQTAYVHLTHSSSLCCLVGYAGTGKSYLLGATLEAWEESGFHVRGMALSGIAAENLENSSGIKSRTIASQLYAWSRGAEQLTSRDVLVVDEAGMIGSRQMARILEEAHSVGAKVVLVGDPEQLQAIDAGAAFRAIAQQANYVELTEVRRQQHPWQRNATKELATQKTEKALERYSKAGCTHEFETAAIARAAVIEQWQAMRVAHPQESQLILAATRRDVQSFNEEIRALRKTNGELGEEISVKTPQGERQLAVHDQVYFLQNDRTLGVKNGTLGTIEGIQGKKLSIRLDGTTQCVEVDTEKYTQLGHGYAATVHKAQGMTVDRAYLHASKYMDRHSTYVGMTRHKQQVDVYYSREEFENEKAMMQSMGRARYKDMSTDYRAMVARLQESRGILLRESLASSERKKGLTLTPAERESLKQKRNPVDPLQQFKQDFERKNPEKAAAIKEELLPKSERTAKQALRDIELLMERGYKGDKTVSKDFAKMVNSLRKQPEVMQSLQKLDKDAYRAVERQLQQLDKSRDRDRGDIER
jgi:Ti-type conjugative transfer relaxase TraA